MIIVERAKDSLLKVTIQLGRHAANCCKITFLDVRFEWGKSKACRERMVTETELRRRKRARCTQLIGELLELYAGHGS